MAAMLFTSCAPARGECEPQGEPIALDADVSEASGVAWSRVHGDVLWVHNDSQGGAVVYAIATSGELIARVTLEGARNRDWEDIAVGPCPEAGPDGDCIYVADIGDNRASRDAVGLWIAAEPDPHTDESVDAVFFPLRYPDGSRDAEAIAVLDDASVIVVTKGREHPISVYRSPPIAWSDAPDTTMLSPIQQLSEAPVHLPDQVTGATRTRDGRTLAVRSYGALQFYRLEGDSVTALLTTPVPLDPLGEPQGEGIAIGSWGRVLLVSEAGPQGIAPRLTRLRCGVP